MILVCCLSVALVSYTCLRPTLLGLSKFAANCHEAVARTPAGIQLSIREKDEQARGRCRSVQVDAERELPLSRGAAASSRSPQPVEDLAREQEFQEAVVSFVTRISLLSMNHFRAANIVSSVLE